MNRRDFLRIGTMGGAISMLGVAAEVASQPVHVEPFQWEEASIAQLKAAMESGKETAVSINKAFLQRIAAIDKAGPAVNAVIELNPDALAIAGALDEERKTKGPRGPLHGIPVMVKDNLDTHDKMMTTAGSLAMLGSIPAADSFVVRKLREAGAVLLG